MLPRIAFLLQLRGKYHRATRDYAHLSRAIDLSQLGASTRAALAAGISPEATGTAAADAARQLRRSSAAGRQGALNSLDDGADGGDYDDLANGRRGGNGNNGDGRHGSAARAEELRAIRAEEYRRRTEIKEVIKGVRAQILFRKIPLTLSRIERLLKPDRSKVGRGIGKKARQAKHAQLLAAAQEKRQLAASSSQLDAATAGGVTSTNTANNDDSAEGDEMLDMMFMGTLDGALAADANANSAIVPNISSGGEAVEAALSEPLDDIDMLMGEGHVDAQQAADDFLFAAEDAGSLTTTMAGGGKRRAAAPIKRRTALQQHVTLANVARFLDTLGYFEGQREMFLAQQSAEYAKAKSEIRNQIHMRHRRLALEHGKAVRDAGTMRGRGGRGDGFKRLVEGDSQMHALKAQLKRVEERETILATSLIARPYTSASLWKAVLRFPALPNEGGGVADPTLRIPYARALSRMLSGIMRVIAKQGSNNCINEESPRFVASTHRSLDEANGQSGPTSPLPGAVSGAEGGWARADAAAVNNNNSSTNNTANTVSDAVNALTAAADPTAAANALQIKGASSPGDGSVAGWIPSPSRNAIELLLLSLLRLGKVFDAFAADCAAAAAAVPQSPTPTPKSNRRGNSAKKEEEEDAATAPAHPLPTPAAATHLAETLFRTQKIAVAVLAAARERIAADADGTTSPMDAHAAEVLSLVGPTLATLDASMTRAGAALVAALLPPTSRSGGASTTDSKAVALTTPSSSSSKQHQQQQKQQLTALSYANKGLAEDLRPPAALLLISRLYQLKAFHPDTPRESRRLLYDLIQKAFPQTKSRTRAVLLKEGRTDNLVAFVTDAQRAALRRVGGNLRDVLDDPVAEAKLQQRRMDALLRARRLEALEQSQAEMVAMTAPLDDLFLLFECLSHAANSAGIGSARKGATTGTRRGLVINTAAFRPASAEAASWSEVLDFALPHTAEAIIARAASDRLLAMRGEDGSTPAGGGATKKEKKAAAEEAASIAVGLNLPRLVKMLQQATPLLDKVQQDARVHNRSSSSHGGGGASSAAATKSSSAAFYLFLLGEMKARLGARLQQEAGRREREERRMSAFADDSSSRGAAGRGGPNGRGRGKKGRADGEALLSEIDDAHEALHDGSVPPIDPFVFVGAVAATGEVMAAIRHASVPVNAAAREVQQLCKALLIEDSRLIADLKPLCREAEEEDDAEEAQQQQQKRKGSLQTKKRTVTHRPTDLYSAMLEGFGQSGMLTQEFHSYVANELWH